MTGSNFVQPVACFVNGVGCGQLNVLSSTRLTCVLPTAVSPCLAPVIVSATGQFSAPVDLLSYAPPTITSVTGCTATGSGSIVNCARNGNTTITIRGANFGARNAVVLIGAVTCSNVVQDTSSPAAAQSFLTCRTPSGNALNQPILVLQSGGQISTSNASLSYAQCPPGQ